MGALACTVDDLTALVRCGTYTHKPRDILKEYTSHKTNFDEGLLSISEKTAQNHIRNYATIMLGEHKIDGHLQRTWSKKAEYLCGLIEDVQTQVNAGIISIQDAKKLYVAFQDMNYHGISQNTYLNRKQKSTSAVVQREYKTKIAPALKNITEKMQSLDKLLYTPKPSKSITFGLLEPRRVAGFLMATASFTYPQRPAEKRYSAQSRMPTTNRILITPPPPVIETYIPIDDAKRQSRIAAQMQRSSYDRLWDNISSELRSELKHRKTQVTSLCGSMYELLTGRKPTYEFMPLRESFGGLHLIGKNIGSFLAQEHEAAMGTSNDDIINAPAKATKNFSWYSKTVSGVVKTLDSIADIVFGRQDKGKVADNATFGTATQSPDPR